MEIRDGDSDRERADERQRGEDIGQCDIDKIYEMVFVIRVRLICFYPNVSTLETFDDFFLPENSHKKSHQGRNFWVE